MSRVRTQYFDFQDAAHPLRLQASTHLKQFRLAYETYGELNADASNAILIFHAMTGSQHASGYNPEVEHLDGRWTEEMHAGWWEGFIGPGKALDTNRYFVICANYLGGCYGSTGPTSVDQDTGEPWGASFPPIRIADIVDSQVHLLDHLGIATLHATAGASIGGMLALSLATRYPDRVRVVIPMASGLETSIHQRILNFEQINAIESDPHFFDGNYPLQAPPTAGLSLARRIAHKTFISLEALRERARGEIMSKTPPFGWYEMSSPVESYMLHQGKKFVRRFDANSYLRILDAWQWFDLVREGMAEDFGDLFARCTRQKFLVFTIDSDLAFYPREQEKMVRLLEDAGVEVVWLTVHSSKGHDSFLLEPRLYAPHIRAILDEE